ncbi:hypothetical protein JQC72_15470 [Polycladomyces sp. WAk]|uniref:Uncharacterized protein n=1 Tax=Polycladomyces zharkentensis TaxID=2807616 RepID=A0ABS2WN04_9BACL|nr:hypothetical protein [Polycladomyces sp. WAk]MBN2910899.1 hypothetical protein [Polycladomyces sp. WAk]
MGTHLAGIFHPVVQKENGMDRLILLQLRKGNKSGSALATKKIILPRIDFLVQKVGELR